MELDITFKPRDGTGILVYTSQKKDGSGSYILAQLENQQFVFSFDAGLGPKILR